MGRYTSYPTGTAFGVLQAQCSEPIAAGAAMTIRVRNNTGKLITMLAAHGFSTTANNQAGTTLDITNVTPTTFLTAAINMQVAAQVNAAAGINPANTTLANGADAYFVFTNAAGGAATAMNDAQATMYYTAEFAST